MKTKTYSIKKLIAFATVTLILSSCGSDSNPMVSNNLRAESSTDSVVAEAPKVNGNLTFKMSKGSEQKGVCNVVMELSNGGEIVIESFECSSTDNGLLYNNIGNNTRLDWIMIDTVKSNEYGDLKQQCAAIKRIAFDGLYCAELSYFKYTVYEKDDKTTVVKELWAQSEDEGYGQSKKGESEVIFSDVLGKHSENKTITTNKSETSTLTLRDIQLTLLDASKKKCRLLLGEPDVSGTLYIGTTEKRAIIYLNKIKENGIVKHLVVFLKYNTVAEIYAVADGEKASFGIHYVYVENGKVISNSPLFGK